MNAVCYMYGTRQKERNQFVKFVCHVLIRNAPHIYGLPLDLCGTRRIRYCVAFCQTRRNSVKRATFLHERRCNPWKKICQTRRNSAKRTQHFHGKSAAILGKVPQSLFAALYKTVHFQEVWRTRRDKHGARYAALTGAAAACLLHCF